MLNIFSRFLDLNQREVDRLKKIVEKINAFEKKYKKFKDVDFKKETDRFKKLISNGYTLDAVR